MNNKCQFVPSENDSVHLERFIDVVFALILGLAATNFIKIFDVSGFSFTAESVAKTLLYLSAVTVLVYDWVAYHLLIQKLPYTRKSYFLRFVIDLALFFVMFLMIASVSESVFTYMKMVSVLFFLVAIWHFVAMIEVRYKIGVESEPDRLIFRSGLLFSLVAGIVFTLLYLGFQTSMGEQIPLPYVHFTVSVLLIAYCVWRYIHVVGDQ